MVSRSSSCNVAQDQHFLLALRATASAISCAGVATLQARQLLITQTASPLGEAAVVQATSGLATAYSLGSVAEFFLSPVFGKMSDRFGRKPILLFFMIGPAIMRTLCALVEQPVARIRLLWLDFASARAVGDLSALGGILGNYLSGWWSLRAGPRSTYLCTAAAPLFSLAFAAACLPETNAEIKDGRPSRDGQSSCSVPDGKTRSAYRTLLLDPESLLIGGALGLYEFLNYAPLNSVAILFMKERLNWGPLEAGRFASGHALAGFCASMLARRLMQFFGKRLYVSVTNLLTSVAYATWAVSKTGPSLIACLLPLSFSGTGGATVLVTRYMERAMQLGLSPGEAMGVRSAIGAVARMLAPQLFTRLWLRALLEFLAEFALVQHLKKEQVGIQPFIGMCQTMITDVYPVDKQPRARAQLGASQAFGNILGNYLSGWWNARAGPRSTYLCTAAAPLLSLAFASACLPETNRDVKDSKASGEPGSVPTSPKTPTARGGKKSAYTTLLLDPECCLLAGVLGMYEFLNYAPLNSVAILFMKERLNWGPLEAGRFASGHALAGFCGSMLAGELIQFFGKRLYVSVTNLLTGVAYATWAVSKTGPSLIACLLPLSVGTGGNTVLLTRFVERAMQLGLSRGEAMGVMSAIGAVEGPTTSFATGSPHVRSGPDRSHPGATLSKFSAFPRPS
ncbi:tetA [Symbiodinium microadriaticum]|nr:tetA [Symbiodinium microadriaticum]